jgi:SAM-dependent methyltransferase
MFDAIAARYDLLNHLLSAGIDRTWRRRAIRSLALTGHERVLDLCTGTADLAIAARTARPPARRVVGVDFAGAMLDVGRTKLVSRQLSSSVTLVRGDATRVPLADASVDAVTIAFGIRNVEDTSAACAEIHRVLIRRPLRHSRVRHPDRSGRSTALSLVFQEYPAAHRPHRLEPQRRLRIPARIGQRVSVAGRARENSETRGIRARLGQPAQPRDRLSLHGDQGMSLEASVCELSQHRSPSVRLIYCP